MDMSDDQQQSGDKAGQDGEGGIPLNITHQYTKDLSFENPAAPGLFINAQTEPPSIDIDVRVEAQALGSNTYEVVLHIRVNATAGSTTLFIAEIAYAAIAEIGEVPEEHLHPFIVIQVPQMIFPFARSILSGMISEGGFPPVLISPVDFVEMYRQTVEKSSETA
jgi:preprotein translocase subunit SecB